MRLFCASTSASPFCTCKSHTLPPSSPEIERIWRSMPDETQRSLLSETSDEENTHTLFVQGIPHIPQIAPSPFIIHPSFSPSKTSTTVSSVPWRHAEDNSSSDNSSVSDFSIPSPSSSYSNLDYPNESDPIRAAHFVYEHAFSGDDSATDTYTRVEELIRMSSNVNISILRSTLRKITMLSFNEMWKSVCTSSCWDNATFTHSTPDLALGTLDLR